MESREKDGTDGINHLDIKLYTKRWFLLTLFMLFTSNVALHWGQFISINNIVSRYYNVPRTLVEWTSIMVMTARAFVLLPSLFLIDKLETRNTLILASTLCLIGSSIKTFSVSPDKFYLVMIGQVFSALSLVFTYSLIGRFSAAWFSSDEISRAGALSCVGEMLGAAFGFLLPSRFVPDSPNVEEVAKGMRYMHYFYMAWALISLILIVIFFKSKPKRPPSAAQGHSRSNKNQQVYKSLKNLLSNPNFMLCVMSQSFFVGLGSNAVNTLLNEMIVTNFPDYSEHAGYLGCVNLMSGIVGSIFLSYIQDRTKMYKCHAVTLSIAICISLSLVTVAMKMGSILYVYIAFTILGFLVQGYYGTTIQMSIELSFPIPEGITVAVISVCVELVSMTSTAIYGLAMRRYGDLRSNICLICVLILSTIAAALVPPKFRREEIERAAKSAEVKGLLYGSEKNPIVPITSTICVRSTGQDIS